MAFAYTPSDRSLPPRPVSPDSLAPAYITFILYCNPHFDLAVDTSMLHHQFLHPPKSDAKEFSTAHLWQLLQKFEAKEIKTWGALATELGVEAPNVSKGQSAQKVQQYTVRLKRWMHAMHIDAFFEYLLGKNHVYFREVPHPSDPFPAGGRDGVVAEEDTAIRALDPSFRPKRGRRRNSDAEAEDEAFNEKVRQARLLGSFAVDGAPQSAYPRSAIPMSAHPDGAGHDPWAAASAVTATGGFGVWGAGGGHLAPQSALTPSVPAHMRWHGGGVTPHPMTALPGGSMAQHIDAAFGAEVEPRSAITPSGKRRRRHGPAVSSAWPSANPPGAKPRGRPPAASKVQDPSFTTFRSAPQPQSQPQLHQPRAADESPGLDATAATPDSPLANMPPPLPIPQAPMRPGRLSLQVPQHTGGPVRLATPPPPRVVVSGDSNAVQAPSSTSQTPDPSSHQQQPPYPPPYQSHVNLQAPAPPPVFPFETLKRTLTTDLLRAELVGRHTRLSGDEAKRLADAMLDRIAVPRIPSLDPATTERENVARLTAASWLGLGDQLNVPLGPAISGSPKRVTLTRFRTDDEGYEEIVPSDWPSDGGGEPLREIWDVNWTSTQGGCTGSFAMKGLTLPAAGVGNQPTGKPPGTDIHDLVLTTVVEAARSLGESAPDEVVLRARVQRSLGRERDRIGGDRPNFVGNAGVGPDGVDWKARCMALEFGSRIAHGEMVRLKGRIMEEVLDVLLRQ